MVRVQLLGRVDALVLDLPEGLLSQLPAVRTVTSRGTQ